MEITLSLLIGDWLKMRGLKWRVEYNRLHMIVADPLECSIPIGSDYVSFTAPTLLRRMINAVTGKEDRSVRISAADPKFFKKLELVMRREERYIHFVYNIVLLVKAIEAVWEPIIGVVGTWFFDVLDAVIKAICDVADFVRERKLRKYSQL